jgi:hypothetical protein
MGSMWISQAFTLKMQTLQAGKQRQQNVDF